MSVKYFDWDDAKNAKLKAERGIGFEDIVFHIERGDLLDILEHPNPDRLRRPAHLCRQARGLRVPGAVPAFAREFDARATARSRRSASRGGGRRGRARALPEDDHPEPESHEGYAKATFRKDRRLNIRLSSKDLEAIQKRALAEGLPYQALISSLLHKYASGRIKEI